MVAYAQMQDVIRDAYAHPDRHTVLYAGWPTTASARLNALGRWDWRPTPNQGIDHAGTISFPLALGCRPRVTSDGRQWIEKLITDPADALAFRAPALYDGYGGELLHRYAALREALPPDTLIGDIDTQSPLGIAELMWDGSFYEALLDAPDAVHAFLDAITEYEIDFIREMQRLTDGMLNPCGWPGLWADFHGTMLSDDSMSLLSPAMHAEFSLPYVNRIAAACGPLFYHSCTWRAAYFDNIRQVHNVAAYNWNPGNSDDSATIMAAFGGRAVLAPHLVRGMHLDNDVLALGRGFPDEVALFRYLLDAAPAHGVTYFYFSDICNDADAIERIYDLLHERGYTPQARGVA